VAADRSVPKTAVDPVCDMTVEIAGARFSAEHGGDMFYFCCPACRTMFENDPASYVTVLA